MKIGELADRTGVNQRMLRYYEEQGLVTPERSDNGYREYTATDVERVVRARSLILAGLPTRLVAPLLEKEEPGWNESCTRDLADELSTALAGLEERLTCLRHSRDAVREFLGRTRREVAG